MQKSILSASGILILGAILLLINGISDSLFSRFYVDMTEEGLYTLSDGSRNILKSVEEPITLRFYYSKTDGSKFPAIKLYGQRVKDLLHEYERQSGGMINLEIYDPRPDSEEEEWAQKYGLTPLTLPTGEQLFFGLAAVNAFGDEDSIPVFNLGRQEFLEYDVTKLIHSMRTAELPKLALISPLNLEGKSEAPPQPGMPPQPDRPWIIAGQLRKIADVNFLGTDVESIPEETDVLMVVFPQNLPEQTRYAIDQYAVKGGNVIIALDPWSAAFQPPQDPQNPFAALSADRSADLPMLANWGVKMKGKDVVGDINLATQVSTRQGAAPQQFPVWVTLTPGAAPGGKDNWIVNQDEIVTSDLETIMIPWGGALELEEKEGLTITPLFRTTAQAMLYKDSDIRFNADRPEALMRKYEPGSEQLVMAAKISGLLKSTFPNKPGAEEAEATMSTEGGHVPQGTKPANVIVIADTDFLADQFAAQERNIFGARIVSLLNDNLIFAVNAAENMSGSNDLISLRSRGRFTRPFTKVLEIEANAQERWKQEESVFQAKFNEANQRLSQLQSGAESASGKQAFSAALLEEIKQIRAERKDAQQKLREVRRKLREDKEQLGGFLFGVNTFLVPVVLIIVSIFLYRRKQQKAKA